VVALADDEIDAIVDAVIERGSPTLDRILAERDDARSEVIMLEWQLSEANKEIERLHRENERLRAALEVEHEIQRQMLERLGIEWTPGEPFYSLVEHEITRWRTGW
jgi:predicted nuclease with TOPRIM domain